MKLMKFSLSGTALPLLITLPFLLLLFSFSNVKSRPQQSSLTDLTGRQLFAAVYLYDQNGSPLFQTMKKIRPVSQGVSGGQATLYGRILDQIMKDDERYFNQFKEELLSGDNVIVREAIRSGCSRLLKAIYQLRGQLTNATSDGSGIQLPSPTNVVVIVPDEDIEYTNLISQPVLPVAITLPLGPPSLPLSNNEANLLGKLASDNFFAEMLVDEIVSAGLQ